MRNARLNLAKIAMLIVLAFLISACGSTYKCPDKRCQNLHDFASLAVACLKIVENTSVVSAFVLSDDIEPRALDALALVRPIRMKSRGLPIESLRLAKGEFLVRKLSVAEAEADCEGTLGPALRAASSIDVENCGTTFLIPFELEGDHWASHSYKTVVCSPDNRIIPKN
jgi:hypothetical protein